MKNFDYTIKKMNRYYRKLIARVRRRKWHPKLLSPLPPFGKKFIKLTNKNKFFTKLVSTRKRAKKLTKKGKKTSRLPLIKKRAPRFPRATKLSTPLHSTGDDLWIKFSESEICPPVRSFYSTITQDGPTAYPKLKTFALSNRRYPPPQDPPSQDTPPQCPISFSEIPKACIFDHFYEQIQTSQNKQHSSWKIYRASDASETLPHEYDIRCRCRASHHWGRNIIESERIYQDHTTCFIM